MIFQWITTMRGNFGHLIEFLREISHFYVDIMRFPLFVEWNSLIETCVDRLDPFQLDPFRVQIVLVILILHSTCWVTSPHVPGEVAQFVHTPNMRMYFRNMANTYFVIQMSIAKWYTSFISTVAIFKLKINLKLFWV